MTTVLYILLGFALALGYSWADEAIRKVVKQRRRQRMMQPKPGRTVVMGVEYPLPEGYDYYRDLIVPVLDSLGTDPKQENERTWMFKFQGFTFLACGPTESPMQRLVLPGILSVAPDDPKLSSVISACNEVASNWGPKFTWEIAHDDEDNTDKYNFSLLFDVVITANAPEPTEQMRMYLGTFFSLLAELRTKLNEIAGKEEASAWKFDSGRMSKEQTN